MKENNRFEDFKKEVSINSSFSIKRGFLFSPLLHISTYRSVVLFAYYSLILFGSLILLLSVPSP
jgi:hypothetical protein